MPLDGLRAWIGEVERKLGVRTRVFLVLSVIAIGGAGAAIYLAVDAHDNAVSESDVQALQQELEARIDAGGGAGAGSLADVTQLEGEVDALQAEVDALQAEGASAGKSGGSSDKSTSEAGGPGAGTTQGAPPPASGGSAAKLDEVLQKNKEESEATEKAEGK